MRVEGSYQSEKLVRDTWYRPYQKEVIEKGINMEGRKIKMWMKNICFSRRHSSFEIRSMGSDKIAKVKGGQILGS